MCLWPPERRGIANCQLPTGPSLAFVTPHSCFPFSQTGEGSRSSQLLETQNQSPWEGVRGVKRCWERECQTQPGAMG